MAKKKNVFDEATFKFFDRLVDLEFLTRTLDQQARNLHSSSKTAMSKWKAKRSAAGQSTKKILGVTTCLSIVNVFGQKFSRFPYGHKSRHDDDMLNMIEEQGHRAQAQCICMLYEAFEGFIKEFTPLLFFQQRNISGWEIGDRKAFHAAKPGKAKAAYKNTVPYFESYVQYCANYNCDPVLSELSRKMPDFKTACTTTWFADLFSIYRAVACIRHTTVHTAGQPSERSKRKLQKWDRELITQLTKQSVLTGEDTILPTITASAVLFEGMAGLAYCLYKSASDLCVMSVKRPRK